MAEAIRNVLFLCTGNSARSILAEAILAKLGAGRFGAYSAGSDPKGEVHPTALQLLSDAGYRIDGLRSKSWDVFTGRDAPRMDFVFTVCGNAAGEVCPVWPGHPATAHWGIEDPAGVEGEGQRFAFARAMGYLHKRISLFLALPLDTIGEADLRRRLAEIGRDEGAA